jgi:hypothetical protein
MDILTGLIAKECKKKKNNDCQNRRNMEKGQTTEKMDLQNEEDLKVMGIRNCQTVARDRKE